MKFLKKAACCAAAAAIALSTMCIGAYAADASQTNESAVLPTAAGDLYEVRMTTDPSVPEAGKEMTLNVTIDSARKIGKLNFEIFFDTGNYVYVPDENNKLFVDASRANSGYIVFSMSNDLNNISGKVLSLKFNVTNPTGEFKFVEDHMPKKVMSGTDDITSQIGRAHV